MEWVPDGEDGIIGYTLFEKTGMRAYIHDNGGHGSSWIVNVDGWFWGWAKDEDEARQMAKDRVIEVDALRAAQKPKHPKGPRGPHSYGRA